MTESHQRLLGEELEFYNKNREQFLHDYTNRHLLIKGDELIGGFLTQDDAVGEGVRRFGIGPFLVRLSGEDTPSASVPMLTLGLPCQS